jgi:hypothetical protein
MRNLILASASYSGLSLACTNGTPVENMLARSPPLPPTADYASKDSVTAEDEEGTFLALEQRHRVRRVRLALPVQKPVMAIDEPEEFPILECLIVYPLRKNSTVLMLPETL